MSEICTELWGQFRIIHSSKHCSIFLINANSYVHHNQRESKKEIQSKMAACASTSASLAWNMAPLRSALPCIQASSTSSLRFSSRSSSSPLRLSRPKSQPGTVRAFVGLAPFHSLLSHFSPGTLSLIVDSGIN